jgi:dihydroflavonol-4-reductase
VKTLVRQNSNRRNLQGLEVEAVVGDLNDRSSLEHAVTGCEALFHVAADYRLGARQPRSVSPPMDRPGARTLRSRFPK